MASLITFFAHDTDKKRASRNAWRTPETTLHLLALFGGWPGALAAQHNDAQEIDTVFGFFVSRVNTHFDMDQQLARVRHPMALKVWVTPERFHFETDPSSIEAEVILSRNLNDMHAHWQWLRRE